jgi:hypothetical protein
MQIRKHIELGGLTPIGILEYRVSNKPSDLKMA